jgi:nicotinate-nucleotide--dimethylbenzimidazole phosphoribosyltransferase
LKTTRRKVLRYAGLTGALGVGERLADAADQPDIVPSAFVAVFAKRQTVRRYKSDPVPDEHVRMILDAARRGPTCMNQQAWKFLVIRDKAKIQGMRAKTLDRIKAALDAAASRQPEEKMQEFAAQRATQLRFYEGYFTAPVYVVVLVDREAPCANYALKHDGPIAAGYLMLAARAFGYGTAYLTDGIPASVTREVLAIPDRYERICITPIGVPDGWPKQVEKRKLEEMVAYETLEGHPPLRRLPYNPI